MADSPNEELNPSKIVAVVRRGRACVRLIEAVDGLLQQKFDQHELGTLQDARRLAVQQLRMIVRDSDPAITAQIMAASDNRLRTAKHVLLT
jgi:hypothetical protein